eukprot:gene1770-5972_t
MAAAGAGRGAGDAALGPGALRDGKLGNFIAQCVGEAEEHKKKTGRAIPFDIAHEIRKAYSTTYGQVSFAYGEVTMLGDGAVDAVANGVAVETAAHFGRLALHVAITGMGPPPLGGVVPPIPADLLAAATAEDLLGDDAGKAEEPLGDGAAVKHERINDDDETR